MAVPGHPQVERSAGGSLVLWDDRWTIRAATIASNGGVDADHLLKPIEGPIERGTDGSFIQLGHEYSEVIDGQQVWTVPTQAATPNSAVIVFFHGHEPGLQERAHAAARTLRPSPP